MPVLRARVTAVRGREVNLENFSDVRGRGSLAREYVITYRDHLESNEHLVAGRSGRRRDAATASRPEVSVEEGIHERFNIMSATTCGSTSSAGRWSRG